MTFAVASYVSAPISTVTFGLATRLWYQSGFFGEPAFDAKIKRRSPSWR
jgi:hypothetical protein